MEEDLTTPHLSPVSSEVILEPQAGIEDPVSIEDDHCVDHCITGVDVEGDASVENACGSIRIEDVSPSYTTPSHSDETMQNGKEESFFEGMPIISGHDIIDNGDVAMDGDESDDPSLIVPTVSPLLKHMNTLCSRGGSGYWRGLMADALGVEAIPVREDTLSSTEDGDADMEATNDLSINQCIHWRGVLDSLRTLESSISTSTDDVGLKEYVVLADRSDFMTRERTMMHHNEVLRDKVILLQNTLRGVFHATARSSKQDRHRGLRKTAVEDSDDDHRVQLPITDATVEKHPLRLQFDSIMDSILNLPEPPRPSLYRDGGNHEDCKASSEMIRRASPLTSMDVTKPSSIVSMMTDRAYKWQPRLFDHYLEPMKIKHETPNDCEEASNKRSNEDVLQRQERTGTSRSKEKNK